MPCSAKLLNDVGQMSGFGLAHEDHMALLGLGDILTRMIATGRLSDVLVPKNIGPSRVRTVSSEDAYDEWRLRSRKTCRGANR